MSKNTSLTIALSAQLIELGGTAPTEIKLLPAGQFKAKDGRPQGLPGWNMNDASATAILAAAGNQADKYLIDYDHQTLHSKDNGQQAPAAGWFGKLEWRADKGLYATDVQWTAAAQAAIEAKEYRYISPVLTYNPNTGDVTGLLMAALVNYPALDGLNDLAAAHFNFLHPEENPAMEELLETLRYCLNLPKSTTPAELSAELDKIKTLITKPDGTTTGLSAVLAEKNNEISALSAKNGDPDMSNYMPSTVVIELQTLVAALSAKIESSELDKLIETNINKLPTPGLQEWAKKQTVSALSAYLETAPEIAALSGMQTDGKPPNSDSQDMINDETAHKAKWNASAELRAEFGEFETYAAFAKAESGGLVKIKGDK